MGYMKIRRHIDEDECMQGLSNYEELFLGGCCGIALVRRGEKDNHICFIHLAEDDGCWFSGGGSMSSFWMVEQINILNTVQEWLSKNAEPDIYQGNQFGWKFKTE